MKRNMELVRIILIGIENSAAGFAPDDLSLDGYTDEEISYHFYIMGQAGLLEVNVTTHMASMGPEATPRNLTWYGHEFLDAAREPTRWAEAKNVIRNAGGASIQVWMEVLTDLVKKGVGL